MTEALFRYYAVDWLLFVLVTLHLWMLGNHYKAAFLVGMAAAVTGFIFGLLTGSVATLVMNVVFFGLHLRAYVRWRILEKETRE